MVHRHPLLSCVSFSLAVFSFFVTAVPAKTILPDGSDHSTPISFHIGDAISVKLRSNLSTRYSWSLAALPACLLQVESTEEQNRNPRIGESGFQVIAFEAADTCDTALPLNDSRPFEKNQPPAKLFSVAISVQPRPGSAQNLQQVSWMEHFLLLLRCSS